MTWHRDKEFGKEQSRLAMRQVVIVHGSSSYLTSNHVFELLVQTVK